MSRSYKKPYWTEGYGNVRRQQEKKLANKKVRKFKGSIPLGNWFKKLYQSWNICDFSFYTPEDTKITRK